MLKNVIYKRCKCICVYIYMLFISLDFKTIVRKYHIRRSAAIPGIQDLGSEIVCCDVDISRLVKLCDDFRSLWSNVAIKVSKWRGQWTSWTVSGRLRVLVHVGDRFQVRLTSHSWSSYIRVWDRLFLAVADKIELLCLIVTNANPNSPSARHRLQEFFGLRSAP